MIVVVVVDAYLVLLKRMQRMLPRCIADYRKEPEEWRRDAQNHRSQDGLESEMVASRVRIFVPEATLPKPLT